MTGAIAEKAISEERCGDADADAVDVDVGNEAEEESPVERQRGKDFEELLDGLPDLDSPPAVGGRGTGVTQGVPGVAAIAEATLREALRVERRIESAERETARQRWVFDWQEDDCAVSQQVILRDLTEARELLEELRSGLFTWFRWFNAGRIVELEPDMLDLLSGLIGRTCPGYAAHWSPLVLHAALAYLDQADASDAARAVAEIEQRRLAELRLRPDGRERSGWPWVQLDRSRWPDGEADTSSGSAKPEQISGLVDSRERRREDDSADQDGALAFPGQGQLGLRLQVWNGDENEMRCLLDLPVLFSDSGPAAERRFLGAVAQIAAEESRRYAEGIAQTAARVLKDDGPAEAAAVSTEPCAKSA